jgi:hypothetical protein
MWTAIAIGLGAFCFGGVIGWITKEAMVRSDKLSISHLAVIAGTLGGGAITKLYSPSGVPFAFYCIGLAIAFGTFTALYDLDDNGIVTFGGRGSGVGKGDGKRKAKQICPECEKRRLAEQGLQM